MAEETAVAVLVRTARRALKALEVAVEVGGGDPKTHVACCELRDALAVYAGRLPAPETAPAGEGSPNA